MNRTYNVAGHKFRVSIPNGDSLWDELTSYVPFIIEDQNSDLLFTLTLTEELVDNKTVVIYSGKDNEKDMPRLDIYSTPEGMLVEMAPIQNAPVCGWLNVSSDLRSASLFTNGKERNRLFAVNNSLMLLYALSTVDKNTLAMHSSVVVYNGIGYMFLGVSGAGKSTHSRMWLENIKDTWLLNDDNPVLRVLDDGSVRVYGTPWSGKTPCYKNADVMVGAMVQITKAPVNEIQKLSILDSYIQVYCSCSGMHEDNHVDDCLHSTINLVLSSVPVYELRCRADEEAARVCSGLIAVKTCGR